MAHTLAPAMQAATLGNVFSPVLFVQINTAGGNVYLWSGYGNFNWNGQTWIGGGNLMGIGAITEQNKVQASGCVLTLSGVDQALIAVVLEDLQRYLPAQCWLGALDYMFNLVINPYQFLNGRIDSAKITMTGKTATIQVSAESRLIVMRNPRVRRYTDIDQRLEHPNDGGFLYVDTIQDATIAFHG